MTGQRKLTHTHPLAELGITSSRAAQGHRYETCPNCSGLILRNHGCGTDPTQVSTASSVKWEYS